MTPDTFRKLAALGLTHDQMAGVLEIFEADAETRKEKARSRVQKWRDRLDVSSSEWIGLSMFVRERDDFTCQYCGSTDGPMHCDHVIPLSQGGTSDPDNLVTACRACNCGKSGRTVEQWRGLS